MNDANGSVYPAVRAHTEVVGGSEFERIDELLSYEGPLIALATTKSGAVLWVWSDVGWDTHCEHKVHRWFLYAVSPDQANELLRGKDTPAVLSDLVRAVAATSKPYMLHLDANFEPRLAVYCDPEDQLPLKSDAEAYAYNARLLELCANASPEDPCTIRVYSGDAPFALHHRLFVMMQFSGLGLFFGYGPSHSPPSDRSTPLLLTLAPTGGLPLQAVRVLSGETKRVFEELLLLWIQQLDERTRLYKVAVGKRVVDPHAWDRVDEHACISPKDRTVLMEFYRWVQRHSTVALMPH